jgi:ADP-dependent NAD(P)H-hydrate dehydratase / NAD(P)H-hydrate epimerase
MIFLLRMSASWRSWRMKWRPHPFYTRGFILHRNNLVPDLIRRAYLHDNAAAHLVVKGQPDYITRGNQVVATVDQPSFAAMEAIGGTGDTLTGLLTVLCTAEGDLTEAAVTAARANRWTGWFVDPGPATQVIELIEKIPDALSKALDQNHKV